MSRQCECVCVSAVDLWITVSCTVFTMFNVNFMSVPIRFAWFEQAMKQNSDCRNPTCSAPFHATTAQ
jgi:hypothetical protein